MIALWAKGHANQMHEPSMAMVKVFANIDPLIQTAIVDVGNNKMPSWVHGHHVCTRHAHSIPWTRLHYFMESPWYFSG